MSPRTDIRLTPRQRLTRGLTYTTVGPVDITRGALGLGIHSAQSTVSAARRRYRAGKLRRELAAAQELIGKELAAAQEVVSGLPQALQDARQSKRHRRRPWVLAAAGAAVLAAGGAAFAIIRRSSHPEPSPRPPSVDVEPKP
jgi:hypothetical protein